MKIASIFLAAVMVSALAGQAAEARDHDGWRIQHRMWRDYSNDRQWRNYNNQMMYQQNWNGWRYDPGNARPWDNAHDNAIRALQEIDAQNRSRYGYFGY